jgi:hypothetical protein
MPAFSLLTPMPGLPWYLLPLWPLVFWRIQRLKAWFRANGGPGSEMLWGVMRNGRVVVIQLSDDLSGHRPWTFRAPVSDRLPLALTDTPTPCPRRRPKRKRRAGPDWSHPRHLTRTATTPHSHPSPSAPTGVANICPAFWIPPIICAT